MSDTTTLSAEEERIFDRALDDIIPPSPDGRLPGAGSLRLAPQLEAALAATPIIWEMVVQSARAGEELARRRDPRGFAALSADEQAQVIAELSASDNSFPPLLMIQTFAAYYQQPAVLAVLGFEARPPHPLGYEMEADDFSLLDPVRARPKFYRDPA